MTELQSRLFEILVAFDAICKKENLKYWLVGGTLLGAARHQGFIPWDDDIDVAMPAKDFMRFIRMQNDLPSWLKIQSRAADCFYPYDFINLHRPDIPFDRNGLRAQNGLYMDIFPLVESRVPNRRVLFYFDMRTVMTYVLQVKWNWERSIPYKVWYARLAYRILQLLPAKWVLHLRDRLYKMIAKEGTGELFSPGGSYRNGKEFCPAEWFEKFDELPFEGRMFPVPVGWQKLLSRNYGSNYMDLPPVEQRRSRHKE